MLCDGALKSGWCAGLALASCQPCCAAVHYNMACGPTCWGLSALLSQQRPQPAVASDQLCACNAQPRHGLLVGNCLQKIAAGLGLHLMHLYLFPFIHLHLKLSG